MPHPPSKQPSCPCREAELKQIRKATLLGTVNNLVFGGGPIIISLAGKPRCSRGGKAGFAGSNGGSGPQHC